MYRKNIGNERSNQKIKNITPSSDLAKGFDFSAQKFIEVFSIFIKQCYCTVESVEK